jgi:hypothetical protein
MSRVTLKKLKKMIIDSGKRTVIVTGPQRSGTTVSGKIISEILGWEYVDEVDFGWEDKDRLKDYIRKGGSVIQAPCFASCCHEFSEDAFIVFMIRPISEILESQKRISWEYSDHELEWNVRRYFKSLPSRFTTPSEAKYYVWDIYQKDIITDYYELDYSDLKGHRFHRSDRSHFGGKQTE